MKNSAFELAENIDKMRIEYRLFQDLWTEHDLAQVDLRYENWSTIKYLNETGEDFHDDIMQLPNDRGGLYMFSIHCPIITGRTEYPVYIGRAQLTKGQNLRKRCREYFTKYQREN